MMLHYNKLWALLLVPTLIGTGCAGKRRKEAIAKSIGAVLDNGTGGGAGAGDIVPTSLAGIIMAQLKANLSAKSGLSEAQAEAVRKAAAKKMAKKKAALLLQDDAAGATAYESQIELFVSDLASGAISGFIDPDLEDVDVETFYNMLDNIVETVFTGMNGNTGALDDTKKATMLYDLSVQVVGGLDEGGFDKTEISDALQRIMVSAVRNLAATGMLTDTNAGPLLAAIVGGSVAALAFTGIADATEEVEGDAEAGLSLSGTARRKIDWKAFEARLPSAMKQVLAAKATPDATLGTVLLALQDEEAATDADEEAATDEEAADEEAATDEEAADEEAATDEEEAAEDEGDVSEEDESYDEDAEFDYEEEGFDPEGEIDADAEPALVFALMIYDLTYGAISSLDEGGLGGDKLPKVAPSIMGAVTANLDNAGFDAEEIAGFVSMSMWGALDSLSAAGITEEDDVMKALGIFVEGFIGSVKDAGLSDDKFGLVISAVVETAVEKLDEIETLPFENYPQACQIIIARATKGLKEVGVDDSKVELVLTLIVEIVNSVMFRLDDIGLDLADIKAFLSKATGAAFGELTDLGFAAEDLAALGKEVATLLAEGLAEEYGELFDDFSYDELDFDAESDLDEFLEDDSGEADSGEADAGEADAGEADAGEADAGEADAGEADAGEADAGEADSGEADAGETDAGGTDTDATDAGTDA
jgi:hypothetical protein